MTSCITEHQQVTEFSSMIGHFLNHNGLEGVTKEFGRLDVSVRLKTHI